MVISMTVDILFRQNILEMYTNSAKNCPSTLSSHVLYPRHILCVLDTECGQVPHARRNPKCPWAGRRVNYLIRTFVELCDK